MNEFRERLDGVRPDLRDAAEMILDIMAKLGHPMFICEGVRSAQRQHFLYLSGRPQLPGGYPGPNLTDVDAGQTGSTHERQADGWGHAVDFAFQGPHPWDESHPWLLFGLLIEALSYAWAGRWKKPVESGHAEVRRG